RGRGARRPAPGRRYVPARDLGQMKELILAEHFASRLATLPGALRDGAAGAVVVRGSHRSGRRTVLGALAAALGRGLLTVEADPARPEDRWRLAGPPARLLGAMRAA